MEKFILKPDGDNLEEVFGVTPKRSSELSLLIAKQLTAVCKEGTFNSASVVKRLLPIAQTDGEAMLIAVQAGRSIEKLMNIFEGKDEMSPLVKFAQVLNKLKQEIH